MEKEVYTIKNPEEEFINKFVTEAVEYYTDLLSDYDDLRIALDEIDRSKDCNVDLFVHASHKAHYLKSKIASKVSKEHELYKDSFMFDYIEDYIKHEYNISDDVFLPSFNYFDLLNSDNYGELVGDVIAVRIVRALQYYRKFNSLKENCLSQDDEEIDYNSLKDYIVYDFSDLLVMNTLNVICRRYSDTSASELIPKYKTLLCFTNPNIESYYLDREFTESPTFLLLNKYNLELAEYMKEQIADTIYAIQDNICVDSSDNEDLFIKGLSIRQIIDILINFKNYRGVYGSRVDAIKNYLADNMEILLILQCYLEQFYINMSEKDLLDLKNELENTMSADPDTLNRFPLSEKIADYFFLKNEVVLEKDITRTRKKKD